MDPKGKIGRFYKKGQIRLLHTKNGSSMPCCFREEDFYVCPIVSLWELMTPGMGPFLTTEA